MTTKNLDGSRTDSNGIRVDDHGYVIGVRCSLNHGGNRGFVQISRGRDEYQCQGCGTFRVAGGIREDQAKASR